MVVTEAGFGADLGAEKFLDIKCRSAGLTPSCAVVVATIRALKMHGGVARAALGKADAAAVGRGVANLARHVENLGKFGMPVVVALNHFLSDTDAEFAMVRDAMAAKGVEVIRCTHWAEGAPGAAELGRAVLKRIASGEAAYKPLYPVEMKLADKIRTIATQIYRAADIALPEAVARRLAGFEEAGFGKLPICVAKTQYSFTADPTVMGAPDGHMLPVREVRLSAGAGFVVAICGEIMTMPGLPRVPAAESIFLQRGRADRRAVLSRLTTARGRGGRTASPAESAPARSDFDLSASTTLLRTARPCGWFRPSLDLRPIRDTYRA